MKNKGKVLVVDNDPIVLGVTRARLESAGYQVVTRDKAPGTSRAILEEDPDVVLLGSQPSSAGTAVRVGVGAQRAPWACTAYRNGTVGDIFFMGGENDGAAAQLPATPGRPAVGSETDLSEFQGARAGQAEGGIKALGYEAVRSDGLTTWWFNRSTGACARITTSNGRYSSVDMLPAEDC